MSRLRIILLLPCLMLAPRSARPDQRLLGIACRSVHLHYPAPEGQAFYNEVAVDQSAPGTYFCACGFSMGYFGMQELADGKKLLLFSVWDAGAQNDPDRVPEDQRVKVLFQGTQVRVGRFGNEATGGQAFFDYDWKVDQPCRFLVTAKQDGQRTAFSAFFFLSDRSEWKHLATFSTLGGGKLLTGYYSFVEDFRRNRVSVTRPRTARYGNGWVRDREGTWVGLAEARFTADSNPAININAGVAGGAFFLATGGATRNTGTILGQSCNRVLAPKAPSTRLPAP
jgi:hypothetical protein